MRSSNAAAAAGSSSTKSTATSPSAAAALDQRTIRPAHVQPWRRPAATPTSSNTLFGSIWPPRPANRPADLASSLASTRSRSVHRSTATITLRRPSINRSDLNLAEGVDRLKIPMLRSIAGRAHSARLLDLSPACKNRAVQQQSGPDPVISDHGREREEGEGKREDREEALGEGKSRMCGGEKNGGRMSRSDESGHPHVQVHLFETQKNQYFSVQFQHSSIQFRSKFTKIDVEKFWKNQHKTEKFQTSII